MLFLVKIHKAEYINDMYQNEYLYFSSLKEFRGEKEESGRLDPRELNLKNVQLSTLTIKTNSTEMPLHEISKEFNGQYMEHLSEPRINCCSLHWFEVEPNEVPSTYNQKLLDMGDKALLIYDYIKFFKMLDDAIESLGYEYSRRKVTYYDPKAYNGQITLHHKDQEYSFQNEFRILIAPTNNQPVFVNLPGLKEISHVTNTKDLEKMQIELI